MSSGAVVGTISTTTCDPFAVSSAASFSSSAAFWPASRVPVASITCATSAGTGCTACAWAVPASAEKLSQNAIATLLIAMYVRLTLG